MLGLIILNNRICYYNGKLNVLSKNTDSLFGKIKDSKTTLIFENGDIKIEKFSAKLRHNTKVESNISILSNNGKPIIQFSAKFFTTDANKFFRKFGIYGFTQDQISFIISGNIDVNNKKINLKEIIKDNNERINNREILIIEKSFNNNVLNDGVLGLLDFFKVKKFIQENY